MVRDDLADQCARADLDRLGNDAHAVTDRRGGVVVDREVGADALLVVLEVRDEHLAGGDFHVVGERPGGVDAVDDHAVEGRAHRLVDDDFVDGPFAGLDRWVHAPQDKGPSETRGRPAAGLLYDALVVLLLSIAAALLIATFTYLLVRGARNPDRRSFAYALARDLAPDPGARDLDYEDWWVDVRGGRLPVWEIECEGDGPTCVIVHGWGQSRIDTLARIDDFRPHVGRIVLYDLRGHGESEAGPSRLGSHEHDDLLALIDRLGEGPVVLAGWSMGGVIAIHAAAESERVRGVLVEAPYDDFPTSLRGRLARGGHPAHGITPIALTWFRLVGLRFRSTREAAARLDVPLLVLHGTGDAISPIEHGRGIADAAPLGSIIEAAGGAHSDFVHQVGDRYADIVETFFRCCSDGQRVECPDANHDATVPQEAHPS